MTQIGASTVYIYKDGTRIATRSYTASGNEYIMGHNTYIHIGSVPYYGVAGQKYYAVVTFYAKNSKGSDSRTYMASTITAK